MAEPHNTGSGGEAAASSTSSPSEHPAEMLTTIPPELRNRIYDLVLSSSVTDEEVDLLSARPPSNALLFVCRQIHDEVKHM